MKKSDVKLDLGLNVCETGFVVPLEWKKSQWLTFLCLWQQQALLMNSDGQPQPIVAQASVYSGAVWAGLHCPPGTHQ